MTHGFCLFFISEFIVDEGCIQDSEKSDLSHDRATLVKSVSIWSGLCIQFEVDDSNKHRHIFSIYQVCWPCFVAQPDISRTVQRGPSMALLIPRVDRKGGSMSEIQPNKACSALGIQPLPGNGDSELLL